VKIEVSIDDGDVLDREVIKMLDKHGLKGVFYVPISSWGGNNLSVYKNHEIGCHTFNHPQDMKKLTSLGLQLEINTAKKTLETYLEHDVTKFCFPRGRYNDRVLKAVADAGFTDARTTQVLYNKDDGGILKHTAVHVFPNRKEYNFRHWLDIAKMMLKDPDSKVLRFWGHAAEIDKFDLWEEFDKLLELISESKHSK